MTSNPTTRVRDQLRRMVDGETQLRCIGEILDRLTSGWEPVRDPRTGSADWVPLDRDRVAALNAALSTHLKLLNKVLPDLKAVELSGPDGERLASGTSDRLVLATKLLAIWREEQEGLVAMDAHEFLQ